MKPQITPYALEKARDENGKVLKSEGRPLYRFHGVGQYAGKGVWLFCGWNIAVHMPEGFLSDLASRPTLKTPGLLMKAVGLALLLIPSSWWDDAAASAGFHDVLCEQPEVPRSTADGIFWAAMHIEGTPPLWRDALFRAVTLNTSKETRNDPSIFDPDQPSLPGLGA